MDRNKVRSIVESVYHKVMNEGVFEDTHDSDYEGFDDDDDEFEDEEEMSSLEEYENDYPNSRFNPDEIGEDELIEFCSNNDFFFVYDNPLMGKRLSVANSDEVREDIIDDITSCRRIERTHEVDGYFKYRHEEWFDDFYVVVFKLYGTKDGDYHVVYMEDKY